jgi:hypothetical protein
MDTDQKQNSSETSGVSLVAPSSASRRRLLRAGLSAAPAILTVVSQPALAVTCRSPSAFASVTANATTSAQPVQGCSGFGPLTWTDTSTTWPVDRATALFYDEFSAAGSLGGIATPTLAQVLALTPANSVEGLARNVVAAYLNLKSLRTPEAVINETSLQAMWTQGKAGTYRPTLSSPYWTFVELNAWFTQTFSLP